MREYEIERKFLLKQLPLNIFQESAVIVSDVSTYYDKDKKNRIRKQQVTTGADHIIEYTSTRKTFIKPGLFDEDENEISREEYLDLADKYPYYIRKKRYQCIIDDYNWFIDVYRDINLVIAEVEILTNSVSLNKSYVEINAITIPSIIEKELIMEVTNFKEFSNANLI